MRLDHHPQSLIVFHKQLGDLLMLEPVISILSKRDRNQSIGILTRSGHAPLVEILPNATFIPRAGSIPFDNVWGFDSGRKTAIKTFWSRAQQRHMRLDADKSPQWFHRLLFRDLRWGHRGSSYMANYYWDMIDPLQGETFQRPTLLVPPPHWKIHESVPHSYLVANVSAGWKSKSWSVDGWTHFLRVWVSETGLPVVITAGDQDWQKRHAEEIHANVPASVNLAGKTTLPEFIKILFHANMVLTVDGFASHVATAYDVPCVTLFQGDTVKNWHIETPLSTAVVATQAENNPRVRLKDLSPVPVLVAAYKVFPSSAYNVKQRV